MISEICSPKSSRIATLRGNLVIACALLLSPLVPARAESGGLNVNSAARPNLIPTNVTLHAYSARPGDQLVVSWTTTNAGTGRAFASTTGIYLGTSSTTAPNTVPGNSNPNGLIMRLITPEIAAKSAVRQTNTVFLPSGLPGGTYYIWIFSDDDSFSSVNQTTRSDDRARSAGLVIGTVIVRPNLVPQDVTVSTDQVRPGDQLTIRWNMRNIGNVTCPSSITGIHLGTSATAPPTNDGLNLRIPTPEIGPASSLLQTNVITIPAGTALGTYYIWIVADDVQTSTLNQVSRTDDFAHSPAFAIVNTITRPNLVPSNITVSTDQARPRDQVTVAWTISNAGNGNCPASTTGLHLGTSATAPPTADGLNLRLPTPAINAGASVRQTNTITIPATTPHGVYYLWVVADDVSNSTLQQTSRADDAARSAAFNIVSVITRPNLVPGNILLSNDFARPGDQIMVAYNITNSGNANCPASITGLHLGASPTSPPATDGIDLQVATPALGANSFVRITNVVTIPANTPLGNYYIWVIADDVENSTLNQSSRADDAARSSVLEIVATIPRPNLRPLNVALSANSGKPGDQITVTWTTTNSGSANCPASTTGIYLGTSPTAPPANDILNIAVATPAINASSAIHQSRIVNIPANTAVGTYYIWVIVDDVENSTLNQTTRDDDAARSAALSLAKAGLITPAADATVSAPPAFTWAANAALTPKIYLASKSAPVLGVDKLVVIENPNGVTTFTSDLTTWLSAVRTLGVAPSYYWTIGSANSTQREIYAEWRAFKSIPVVATGTHLPSNEFRLQIIAPHQAQVTIQFTDNLSNPWNDLSTIQNLNGIPTFSDPAANTRSQRYYRAKP